MLVDEDAVPGDLGACYPYAVGCTENVDGEWSCEGDCLPGLFLCNEGAIICDNPLGPAIEICDDFDNDCDGLVDEAFNIITDLKTCGSCDNDCTSPLPTSTIALNCLDGACIWACEAGAFDLDGDLTSLGPAGTGCEYSCSLTAPANTEFCDGLDNDCDGLTDEESDLFAAPTTLCKTEAGTLCEGATPRCVQGPEGFGYGYYCDYPSAVETFSDNPNQVLYQETLCDYEDGDCDGVTDEGFVPALGSDCASEDLGACQSHGIIQCDEAGAGTVCFVTKEGSIPLPESCDGIDNDCDGLVDEREDADSNGVFVEEIMARIESATASFTIYVYEASHPDATATEPGSSTTRSCSRSGVLPWASATLAEAEEACQAAGMRLCTATEWALACASNVNNGFPYGQDYESGTCNGLDYSSGQTGPTGSLASCASQGVDANIYDLSGNLKEWVDDGSTTVFHQVRGGSFESPEAALRCDFDFTVVNDTAKLGTVGFRCCSD